jgi:D-alanyl-D-alanine carboxypeptidase
MRNLLAENLEKAASKRTVAAIAERSPSDANTDVADDESEQRPEPAAQAQNAAQFASAEPAAPPARSAAPVTRSIFAAATASVPQARTEPAPLTNGVIQTQALAAIPGSSEPMKPVKVKTVQVKAGQVRLASAGSSQPATPITSAIPTARQEVPETSSALVAKAETKAELLPQPANHGTGNGLLGVLPASSRPTSSASQALAYADPAPHPQTQAAQQTNAAKPAASHTGWIVQVGALESENEAQQRIDAARNQAHGLLAKADPFTEPVVAKGDRKLYRARFAGLDRDQAEAVCRTLKRSDISCITVRN